MAESEDRQASWAALGLRTDIPHPARVYDYMLGGKDNFAADWEMAERGLELVPEMRDSSRGNRDFLIRAVAFARDAGIRQFLDIGTGLPLSPNTHEVARLGQPDARVVYVDNDHCKSGCAHGATPLLRSPRSLKTQDRGGSSVAFAYPEQRPTGTGRSGGRACVRLASEASDLRSP